MPRTLVVPFVGGVCGGALTVLILWLASQAWPSEGASAEVEPEPETMLSAIDAIAVVHQVRSDDTQDDSVETMREVIAAMCPGEEPEWRAVYLYGKWEVTARCTAMPESPVWFVTEPELRVVPYTNAAGRLTR
jgi:hypothetical protein